MNRLTIEVLAESKFTPEGGEVLFKEDGKDEVFKIGLAEAKNTGLKLPEYVKYLNPVQTVFNMFSDGHDKVLVATPTSSGKTIVALIMMNRFLNQGKRVVFTAPLKALTREKFNEFVGIFGSDSVERRDGDSFINNYTPIKEKTKIVITTNEFLSTAIRNNSEWLNSVGLFVIDEIHQIYKKFSLEEILIYAKENDRAVLGLSATIPNIKELADYINATLVIKSNFRPVALTRTIEKTVGSQKYKEFLLNKIKEHVSKNEKVILFTTKKSMWNILEEANRSEDFVVVNETTPFQKDEEIEKKDNPIKIAVHNAAVPQEERAKIEDMFKRQDLNVILATQTLAYGINMPADTVIIHTMQISKEGKKYMFPDQLDIVQMEGRAGRFGIKEKGFSVLVPMNVKKEELEKYMNMTFVPETELRFRDIMNVLLIAIKNKGHDFISFINQMFKKIETKYIDKALRFLFYYNYIAENFKITEKGEFCLRHGIDPLALETALEFSKKDMPLHLKARPLLYMKNFSDSVSLINDDNLEAMQYNMILYYDMASWIEKEFINDLLNFLDTTIAYDMYIRGELVEYPNISGVPGDLSSLSRDAVYVIRLLLAMKEKNWITIDNKTILKIAHAVKFGLEPEFSYIGTIPRIGYIRANLIKKFLKDFIHHSIYENLGFTSKLKDLESIISSENHYDYFLNFYKNTRQLEDSRAKAEITKLANILMGEKYIYENRSTGKQERLLVDREILIAGVLEKTEKSKITASYVKHISSLPSEELLKMFENE